MQLQKPKAMLFDWDNTIIDARNSIFSALNKTLIEQGKEPSKNYISGHHREKYFKYHFGKDWEIINKSFKKKLMQESFEELIFFSDVIPLLKNLKKDGIYTAVVSNKIGNLLRKEVSRFNLNRYFDKIIGSGDTKEDKPSPTPIIASLTDSNIEINKKNVYFIGDSQTDLECAKNAGITPILYQPVTPVEDVLQVKNYKNLLKLLGY